MIGDLPGGRSTEDFSTPNASGSTSQAANIAEALEVGHLAAPGGRGHQRDELHDPGRADARAGPQRAHLPVYRPGAPAAPLSGRLDGRRRRRGRRLPGRGGPRDPDGGLRALGRHPARPRGRRGGSRPAPRSQTERDATARSAPRPRLLDRPAARANARRARGRGLHTIELGRERVDLSYLEQLAEAGQTEAAARIIGEFAAAARAAAMRELVEEALASISRERPRLPRRLQGTSRGAEPAARAGGGGGDKPHPLARGERRSGRAT